MSLDGFLTVFAIAIAVFAVLPPVSRLRLSIRRLPLGITSVVSALIICWLQFLPTIERLCSGSTATACALDQRQYFKTIQPEQVAFAIVVIWFLAGWLILAIPRSSVAAVPDIARTVNALRREQRFAELIDIVEPHLDLIRRVAKRGALLARIHDRLEGVGKKWLAAPWRDSRISGNYPKGRTARECFLAVYFTSIARLALIVPTRRRHEAAANNILRLLLRDPQAQTFIVDFRPEFGVRLLSVEMQDVHEFCSYFLQNLLQRRSGLLCREVRDAQGIGDCAYAIPEHSVLLSYLFSDARVAEKLTVWRPVGDYMMSVLTNPTSYELPLSLNGPQPIDPDARWGNPIYVGISFFDIMVRAAACQDVQWHMWLYYAPHWVRELWSKHRCQGESGVASEGYSEGLFLIEEIFSRLLSWVALLQVVPAGSRHREISARVGELQNSNIPVSASVAVGIALGYLLSTEGNCRFRRSIHDAILSQIRRLSVDDAELMLRRHLIHSVLTRGRQHECDSNYGAELSRYWGSFDAAYKGQLEDYRAALFARYGEHGREPRHPAP